MKLVASLEIKKEHIQFIDVDRLVQNITDHIIRSLIEEKDLSMEETGGSKNPKALDLVRSYDEAISSIDIRKWTKTGG
jgi:hypothetical protein